MSIAANNNIQNTGCFFVHFVIWCLPNKNNACFETSLYITAQIFEHKRFENCCIFKHFDYNRKVGAYARIKCILIKIQFLPYMVTIVDLMSEMIETLSNLIKTRWKGEKELNTIWWNENIPCYDFLGVKCVSWKNE